MSRIWLDGLKALQILILDTYEALPSRLASALEAEQALLK